MIKIALPKGDVQDPVKNFLEESGLDISGYHKDARAYASSVKGPAEIFTKQFREKDIPIQVSIGNYDVGLCSSQWLAEHLANYPRADIMNIRTLDIVEGGLCVCCAASEPEDEPDKILRRMSKAGPVRIATQFPGLAEDYALHKRLPDFRIFPLWGAAEAYPPEGAELAIITVKDELFLIENSLRIVEKLAPVRISMIANKRHFENKNLTPVLDKLV